MSEQHSTASGIADSLGKEELARIDAYWRAANYLSVGQIYLLDNPLLREPLALQHIKPQLWGTGAPRPASISSMSISTGSSRRATSI